MNCWIHLWVLVVSCWNLWGSVCTVLYHLQIMTLLLLSFQFGCLLFLFLVWLVWLALPVLCWIREVKANITILFSILMGISVVFAHWVWSWQWVCHIWPLLCSGMFTSTTVIQHGTGSPSHSNHTRRRSKKHPNWK